MTQDRFPKMAMGQNDRIAHPQPTRLSSNSHHSSSVPSTPFQQARDLRFHSRSPSPRGIGNGNYSPRSVASDANGRRGLPNGAPVVCKFESGAEIKRRRIPYKDDGNQELGPPQIEPKKTLDPDEEEKLSGDMRELYDRLLPSEESEGRRTKLIQKLERILNDEWPDSDIRVNVFGSSGNLLSSEDSDVDICITTPLKAVESMHSIAHLLNKHGMQKVICRASAKVPIVKCWDPELNLSADMNVNNPLALENTRMIKTYVQLDPRVRPLAKVIKYWTKQRCLNDAAFGGTISSYTWICMILSFLQRRDPPILPSLQKTKGKRRHSEQVTESAFADDLDALNGFGDSNQESQASLLFHFFRHYGYEFDYSKYVVSVREGRLVTRKEKGWHPSNYQEKEARNRLCVEEPFTVVRNLGNSADDYAWSGIHTEIRRAFDLISEGQLSVACEEYIFPPEEKTIFQKPAPKAPVTLRRSASQTNRPNQESGQGRSRKNNRNQSAQRSSNRRASSGATFNNGRVPYFGYPMSPLGVSPVDFLVPKGNLHDQLFQQYQFLQAQQDVLRSQLAAREQAQAQIRKSSDVTSTPSRLNTNGIQGLRYPEGPQTAPLLPGTLFHYPQAFARALPQTHPKQHDGANTNPSSPSLATAVPALRRQAHRASIIEGSPTSIRSQSQPGRSLPHPISIQQYVYPGYDVSGALPTPTQYVRTAMPFNQSQLSSHLPFPPNFTKRQSENAMPKEYLGYTMSSSPQLLPQQHIPTPYGFSMPHINLRDAPIPRPRRVTPEHGLGLPNGHPGSRSPSPFSQSRQSTISKETHSIPHGGMQSPTTSDSLASATSGTQPTEPEIGAPVIVNGSNPPIEFTLGRIDGLSKWKSSMSSEKCEEEKPVSAVPDPLLPGAGSEISRGVAADVSPNSSPLIQSMPNGYAEMTPSSTPPNSKGSNEHRILMTPIQAPLLSPVAELRTPSPTHPLPGEKRDELKRNSLAKVVQVAHDQDVKEQQGQPHIEVAVQTINARAAYPVVTSTPPINKASETIPAKISQHSHLENSISTNSNPWQQAIRKGHKKSKSLGSQRALGGQLMPANMSERKGG